MYINKYEEVTNEILNLSETIDTELLLEISRVFKRLWFSYNILPFSLSYDGDGGLTCRFKTENNKVIVVLELYKDLSGVLLTVGGTNIDGMLDIPKGNKVNFICLTVSRILQK